jgi:hypothetical protein
MEGLQNLTIKSSEEIEMEFSVFGINEEKDQNKKCNYIPDEMLSTDFIPFDSKDNAKDDTN